MSPMTEQEYVERRLDDQIGWFDRKSGLHQRRFKLLRLLEIVAAAAVPALVALGQESAAAVSGALVTVLAGALALYRFDETWSSYRSTWSALEREKMLHAARIEPYGDPASRYERLVRRVEGILADESKAWIEIRAASQEASTESG